MEDAASHWQQAGAAAEFLVGQVTGQQDGQAVYPDIAPIVRLDEVRLAAHRAMDADADLEPASRGFGLVSPTS